MVSLKAVATVLNGDRSSNYPSKSDFLDYGEPFINAGHLRNGTIDYTNMDYISSEKLNSLSGARIQSGDVLLCLRGSLGKNAFVSKSGGAPASSIAVIRANATVMNPNFLAYVVSSSIFQKQIEIDNNGSSQPNLSARSVEDFLIPCPDAVEQRRIAEALSDMDELIFSLEKLIEKKKAIKQGAMQELLTGKRRLPGFNEEWRSVCLAEIGHFVKGAGIGRSDAETGEIPAVRYGELYTKHENYVKQYYSHISPDFALASTPATIGCVLFAASGETKEEIGKCAAIIDNTTVYAGGDILVFFPDIPVHPVFLGTLLNMPEVCKQKAKCGQGDAIVHIHADSLANVKIVIPDYKEQSAIAKVLLSADSEIDFLEKRIRKARHVKQGMMQQLLTGKTRIIE